MHQPAAQDYSTDTNRLELLLDAIADYAIYMLDPDGFVTPWNAAAERIKGYQAIEIVGQHFSRFFTPEDRASGFPERILQDARAHGRHEAEGWRVRKDGTRFWANAIAQPVRDEQGALVSGRYFYHKRIQAAHPAAADANFQDQLLEACAQLTGVPLPASLREGR